MIKILFPFKPEPKLRPRTTKSGITYTPEKTRAYEAQVRLIAANAYKGGPLTGPLMVKLLFSLPKPKTVKRDVPIVKPDLDNLCKSVIDGCNAICWIDDTQIVELFAKKVYSDKGKPGFTELTVMTLDEEKT